MDERHNMARGANEWADTYGDMGRAPTEQQLSLPIAILDPWADAKGEAQPFDEYSTEALENLAQDIDRNGLTDAILVRPLPSGRFQIVSGHHRVKAFQILGRGKIPATVREMDDLTAESCMLSANLQSRKGNKPSSTARIYKRLLVVTQQQIKKGQRTDLTAPTSPHNVARLRSDDVTAKSIGVSGETLRRYISLLQLKKPLLDMVDDGAIPPTAGFELAPLYKDIQDLLLNVMSELGIKKLSVSQAKRVAAVDQRHYPMTHDEMVEALQGSRKKEKAGNSDLTVKVTLPLPPETVQAIKANTELMEALQSLLADAVMNAIQEGEEQ